MQFENKEFNIIIRPDSEFNLQAELFIKLREIFEKRGLTVYGEVRLICFNKTNGTRKQKGRLDIAIFKGSKLLCAVEVKNKKITGWNRQKKLYKELGVPKLILCQNKGGINEAIKLCKEYLT